MLWSPELDTVLQTRSHKSRVERENDLPQPACHISFDAVQDTVGCLDCKCTWLSIKQTEKFFGNWNMANHIHLPKTVRRKIHRTTRLVNLTWIPIKFTEQVVLKKLFRTATWFGLASMDLPRGNLAWPTCLLWWNNWMKTAGQVPSLSLSKAFDTFFDSIPIVILRALWVGWSLR